MLHLTLINLVSLCGDQDGKETSDEEKAEAEAALKSVLEALARELFGVRTTSTVRDAADFILKVIHLLAQALHLRNAHDDEPSAASAMLTK